jgi:tRNA dimethylallyltransferase
VGKTEVSLELARQRGFELVSADSMSVYRGMDLGTAKPTPAERAGLAYHLIDLADPSEEYSVGRFGHEAAEVLRWIEERGSTALLVGGTGLYVRAVVDDLSIPGRWPDVAASLEATADAEGLDALHARLSQLDPVAAGRIAVSNRRRLVRALEVTIGSGRPFSSYGPGLEEYRSSRFCLVGLEMEIATLYRRIEERFSDQLARGLVEEVRQLARAPLSRTARQAVGYGEILSYLEGHLSLEEALDRAVRRTRRLARRQLSWFRRDPRVRWLEAGDNALAVAGAVLGEWGRCGS